MERRRSAVVWSLGVTQVIGYGTLYYSFSIRAPEMAQDFNWPLEWIFGAFSASLLAGGLAAPLYRPHDKPPGYSSIGSPQGR